MTAVTPVSDADRLCPCTDEVHAERFPWDHRSEFPSAMEAARMHIMGFLDLEWIFTVGETVEFLPHAGAGLAGLVGKISEIKPVQVVVEVPMADGAFEVQVMYHMVAKVAVAPAESEDDVSENVAA